MAAAFFCSTALSITKSVPPLCTHSIMLFSHWLHTVFIYVILLFYVCFFHYMISSTYIWVIYYFYGNCILKIQIYDIQYSITTYMLNQKQANVLIWAKINKPLSREKGDYWLFCIYLPQIHRKPSPMEEYVS